MSKSRLEISIAKDFSREPVGRYFSDGDRSGQAFRENKLVPALGRADLVIVNLDGTEGYGSSFLEEAFAGLLRQLDFNAEAFRRRVNFVATEDPTLVTEILGYVDEEDGRQRLKN